MPVLVVDDHPDAADCVAALLASASSRSHAARSSGAALDAADEVGPDEVVLEPLMNDGGGWEVAARLRRRYGRDRRWWP